MKIPRGLWKNFAKRICIFWERIRFSVKYFPFYRKAHIFFSKWWHCHCLKCLCDLCIGHMILEMKFFVLTHACILHILHSGRRILVTRDEFTNLFDRSILLANHLSQVRPRKASDRLKNREASDRNFFSLLEYSRMYPLFKNECIATTNRCTIVPKFARASIYLFICTLVYEINARLLHLVYMYLPS